MNLAAAWKAKAKKERALRLKAQERARLHVLFKDDGGVLLKIAEVEVHLGPENEPEGITVNLPIDLNKRPTLFHPL